MGLRIYLYTVEGEDHEGLKALPGIYSQEASRTRSEVGEVGDAGDAGDATAEKNNGRTKEVRRKGPEKAEKGPRRIRGALKKPSPKDSESGELADRKIQIQIFFSSITATTTKRAEGFKSQLDASLSRLEPISNCEFLPSEVQDLAEIDFDDYFITAPKPTSDTRLALPILKS